ncbi:tRNA pseudouridine(65) synthase TruC [soil metagenome]
MHLDIIYEDEYFLAINKPAGLLVHRTRIATEKKIFALQLLRDQVGYRVFPLHRLDRPTSGVLLFSKSSKAANIMGNLFESRTIEKIYFAVVRGFTPDSQTIDYPLKNNENNIVQDAITSYSTLANIELPIPVGRYETCRYSLVKIRPLTGRMHQIRKHFGHIRHYIIGDTSHGDWRHNRMFKEEFSCNQLFLHAYSVKFIHPFLNKSIQINAEFPDHFSLILKKFKWEDLME